VGRAPVDTPAEVGVFVEKIIHYETQTHPHATNVLVLAEFLADTPTGPGPGGDMFDPLAPLFSAYQVAMLDDRPFTTPQWTKTDALNALNRSPYLVILNGHGNDETLIGVNYPFLRSVEISDLDALTNTRPFLAYSVACNIGQFDNDRFSPDSVGEETIKRHSRAPSRRSSIHEWVGMTRKTRRSTVVSFNIVFLKICSSLETRISGSPTNSPSMICLATSRPRGS